MPREHTGVHAKATVSKASVRCRSSRWIRPLSLSAILGPGHQISPSRWQDSSEEAQGAAGPHQRPGGRYTTNASSNVSRARGSSLPPHPVSGLTVSPRVPGWEEPPPTTCCTCSDCPDVLSHPGANLGRNERYTEAAAAKTRPIRPV
ncbi:hypothetical protein NDU88_009181 [Pleurodeles waltl]|uniref:Uncharacterized protein n=1 Tax=Pleurodeles waltl TaxID=8319 RepID=A0AAV7P363_PLEWA|nr:hypothetical protein NDU88_009181 [Pleurodeles waltl]